MVCRCKTTNSTKNTLKTKIWSECEYKYKRSVTDLKIGEDCPDLSSSAKRV